VPDRIGNADAELRGNAFFDGNGAVVLLQGQDDAVGLPPRLLSGLHSFTVLIWLQVRTNTCGQRAFELLFSSSRGNSGNDNAEQGAMIYASTHACPDSLPAGGYIELQRNLTLQGDQPIGLRELVQLGLAYDQATHTLTLIVNGHVQKQADARINLTPFDRSTGSLGQSINARAPSLAGSISEFRVYAEALDATSLAEVFRRGPDAL
jgi:hypothetical protein